MASDPRRLFPELRFRADQQDLVAGLVVVALVVGAGVALARAGLGPFAGADLRPAALAGAAGGDDGRAGVSTGDERALAVGERAVVSGDARTGAPRTDDPPAGRSGDGARSGAGQTTPPTAPSEPSVGSIAATDGSTPLTFAAPPRGGTTATEPAKPDPSLVAGAGPAASGVAATPGDLGAVAAELRTINEDTAGFFGASSVQLDTAALALLDRVATLLRDHPAVRLEVGGHTDRDGATALNQRLSQGRAEAVVDYLVEQGIAPDRLEAVGYGDTRPRFDNDTLDGRLANRRIEFTLLDDGTSG